MSDTTEQLKYPESEILDMVEHDGPVTTREAAGSIFSLDQAIDALESLETKGFVESERGNLDKFGSTERHWYVPPDGDDQ